MRHLLLLSIMLGGCSWVSSSDLDCQLQLVDDDGDGFPLNEVEAGYEGADRCSHLVPVDCDDGDAGIFPGAEDAWYDGIDADCALDDDFDQDGDGYVADEYEGVATEGVDGTGALPGGDCDDAALSVYPGSNDVWYDGTDTDCVGNDDYDQDGDGYVADDYIGLATTYVDGSGSLPGGDCDDTIAGTNPGQSDTWYDGIDTDCSGNDDYDQDRDGYVPDAYEGLVTTYVSGSGRLPGGDCDDTDRFIHEGAPDTWYDGVDSDCAEDDDYDQDLDGHRDMATAKDGDDCDDVDATSYPGAEETFGDGVDHDCDGDADTFILTDLDDISWVNPQSLLFRGTDSQVFLALTAEEMSLGTTDYYDSTIALAYDATDPSLGYVDTVTWLRNFADPAPNVLTPGHDIWLTDEILYGAIGIRTASTRQLVVRAWDIAASTSSATNPPVTASLSFEDVSIALDGSGNIHAVGCTVTESPLAFAYLWTTPTTLASNGYEDTYSADTRASTCDLDFYAANGDGTLIMTELTTVGGGPADDTGSLPGTEVTALTFYTFGLPAEGESASFVHQATLEGYEPATVQVFDYAPDRLLVLTQPGTNSIEVIEVDSTFAATPVYSVLNRVGRIATASSVLASDGMIYVLAANDLGDLTLYFGLPGVMPSMQSVAFDPGFMVEETAVWVDAAGSHLYLAASGYDASAGIDRVAFGYAAL